MFKKKCPQCENKIDKRYKFCPFCGYNLYSKNEYYGEDYGFLGRDDFDDSFESMFSNLPFNRLFKTAMKMTEKMIKNMQESNQPQPYSNVDIQFFVNGKRVFPQKITTTQTQQNSSLQKRQSLLLSKEKAERFAKLPRKEPKTIMKRLAGKIVYEIIMPGVKNINDVLINQLENSIEIKALSKDKVYSKTLNVNLPIISYELYRGNLILELQAK